MTICLFMTVCVLYGLSPKLCATSEVLKVVLC
jgi:hypothetical protein